MTATNYRGLVRYLNTPERTAGSSRELLKEDVWWPSPETHEQASGLFEQFPQEVQMYFGIVAADMAASVWARDNPENAVAASGLVERAVELFHGAKLKRSERREAQKLIPLTQRMTRFAHGISLESSASAYLSVMYDRGFRQRNDNAARSYARHALYAAERLWLDTPGGLPQFFKEWWSECRRRLPIVDIDTAVLE